MAQDSGLWKRGVILFALLGLISSIVLLILFSGSENKPNSEALKADHVVAAMPAPVAPVPAGIPWGGYYVLSSELPSPDGWQIRYSAALALARRGSKKLPLHLMCEMLDEHRQQINYRKISPDGSAQYDQSAAQQVIVNSLRFFVEWHKKTKVDKKFDPENADLQKVFLAIHALAQSSNESIKLEANKALNELGQTG